MRINKRFFEHVASSINEMRGMVQNDLDRCYSVNGSIVLDQLTKRLADVFSADYANFDRDAFLKASYIPEGSGHFRDSACEHAARNASNELRVLLNATLSLLHLSLANAVS